MISLRVREEFGMKPTVVTSVEKMGKYYCVECKEKGDFIVKSFCDGILIVEAFIGTAFDESVRRIVGCFVRGSNFTKELFKVFNCNQEITKVRIIYDGLRLEFEIKEIDEKKDVEEYIRVCE